MANPTPEQHAAWKNLQDELRREDLPVIGFSLAVLAPLLPDTLTNPKPELPKEPGRYQDKDGDDGWELNASGTWYFNGKLATQIMGLDPHDCAPFVRLAPERPKVTSEQLQGAFFNAGGSQRLKQSWEAVAKVANGETE